MKLLKVQKISWASWLTLEISCLVILGFHAKPRYFKFSPFAQFIHLGLIYGHSSVVEKPLNFDAHSLYPSLFFFLNFIKES